MIPGIFDAFLRMIPYDNLLTAPIRTGMTLARRLGRNGLKTAGFAQSEFSFSTFELTVESDH